MIPIWIALVVHVVMLAVYLFLVSKENKKYIRADAQWRKWENEYWLLRTKVEDDYDIHLSFTQRGEDDCIKKKESK